MATRRPGSWRIQSLAGLVLAATGAATLAADAPKITRAGIHLGGPIAGPDVTEKSLEGRVVLLEMWGIGCPPCATTMPELERLHRTLGPQGLIVIGAHAGEGAADEVARAVASLGVTFPIIGSAAVEGLEQVPQMPFTLLFDHTGKCVFGGSALEVGPVVAAAVNAAPPLVLNGRGLQKLASLHPLLRNEASFGTALRKARAMASSKDAETADEAKFVVDTLEAWGRGIVDKAPEAREADPAGALDALQRCATAFRGDAIGTDATDLVGAWKKDPAFQAALKCGQQLANLESLRSGLLGFGRVVTPDIAAAVPPELKKQMKAVADGVQKAAPGSKMAERAGEIAAEFGLDAVAGR